MSEHPTLGSDVTWPDLELHGERIICGILRRRLAQETGTIVIFVGAPGSGKSFSALRLATQLDTTFTADRVVFDVKSYLEILARGTAPGQVVLLDEAGVSAPSRKWQSATNQALALTVETV